MSKRMRLGLLLVTFLFVAPIEASSSSAWIKLTPTGGPPPAREFHTSVYDPATNRLIIFGGCAPAPASCNSGRLNDLWVLANANGQGGTPTWIQLTPTGGPPAARFRHAAVYDSVNNRMVIWGGDSTFGSLPDLTDVWVLTNANGLDKATGLPATPNWSQLFPIGGPPTSGVSFPGREVSTAVYDSITNRMIVFGGAACDPCTAKNDVWVLTNANGLGGTPEWLELFPTGGPPAPRMEHSAIYDSAGNRMVIFGGHATLSDTWVLANASGIDRGTGTPTTSVWTQLAATGTLPSPRTFHAAAYDAATNRMVVFGGAPIGPGPCLNDVWLLDNANGAGAPTSAWSQILPTGTAPSPRFVSYHYQLYDGASNTMLVFGGESCGVGLNDSWVLTEANGIITVAIDIKPGEDPPSINPKAQGKIPVAILSSSTFDATTQVDRTSLTFGHTGNEQSLAFCNRGGEDVNGDGLLDLVCHFDTPKTGFQTGDTVGVLKGKTVTGTAIKGTDSIRIVP